VIDLTGPPRRWPEEATATWLKAFGRAAVEPIAWMTPPRAGDEELRQLLAEELGHDPAKLVITGGARAAAIGIFRSGQSMYMERPTFLGVRKALVAVGVDVRAVTWNQIRHFSVEGMSPDIAAWVTIPARNPDGAMPGSALQSVLAALAHRGNRVVQNETYHWYEPGHPRIEGACYVGSFAKLAGGGARLGWAVGSDIKTVATGYLRGATPATLWQRAWAHFLRLGGLERLREGVVGPTVAVLLRFMETTSDFIDWSSAKANRGPSLLLRAPTATDEQAVVALMKHRGLLVSPAAAFEASAPGVRVCFTGVDTAEVECAAQRLRSLSLPLEAVTAGDVE